MAGGTNAGGRGNQETGYLLLLSGSYLAGCLHIEFIERRLARESPCTAVSDALERGREGRVLEVLVPSRDTIETGRRVLLRPVQLVLSLPSREPAELHDVVDTAAAVHVTTSTEKHFFR